MDSLAVSALQDAGGYAISRQSVDWVMLHWFACGADERSVGREGVRSRDYQMSSDG